MTELPQTLYNVATAGLFLSLILYVAFGQITVRKLRRNVETKERLGIEFASGLDIFNVAQALSLPRALSQILDRSRLSALHANSVLLYQHTTKWDRWLARTVYWLLITSVLMLMSTAICSGF